MTEAGVILEFVVIGGCVKVTALDAHTMDEVSIMGPVNYPRKLLAKQAVRKLQAVQQRRYGQHGNA